MPELADMRCLAFVLLLGACGRIAFEPQADGGASDAAPFSSLAQRAYLKASNGGAAAADDELGYSVALSGDTLVVGARLEDSDGSSETNELAPASGAVYVFIRSGGSWVQQAYLKANNGDADDRFGSAVAIDGDTLVVGARFEDCSCRGVGVAGTDDTAADSGAAYVFVRTGTSWGLEAYLKSSISDADDNFGYDVAIDGDSIVVGALQDDGPTNSEADRGAAYVFVRTAGAWSEQAALFASTAQPGSLFGRSVAIDGDRIVGGAYEEGAGAAYVFERAGTTWSETTRLVAANADPGDAFGFSVSLSGDTIAVGARDEGSSATGIAGDGTNNSAPIAGAVYIFDRTDTTWTQDAYIKASNAEPDDQFGFSVSIDGDLLAVGADSEKSLAVGIDGDQTDNSSTIPLTGDATASGPGAVYLFQRAGGAWSQLAYIKASNTINDDPGTGTRAGNQFGYSVALHGARLAAGAIYEDSPGIGVDGAQTQPGAGPAGPAENSGAVYIFE